MDAVEEVKARLSIEEVVGQHVDLKRSGSGLKGLCPFHTEKTPSFFVFPNRGTFHCFGCGQGGDLLTFVQSYEKVDFLEALQRLAGRAGVELPDDRTRRQEVEVHARLYGANEAAAEFFREQLKTATGKRAVEYMARRRIFAQAQHTFALGYAPDSHTALQDELSKRGFSDEEMVSAGLLVIPEDGSRPRDRFRGRLMFPIKDARGRITGFGGRLLGDGEPKYLNSPQSEIFDKSRSLFAIHLAQETIRNGKRAVVVEGYLDAIRAHDAGFRDVVASLGTAITPPQLQTCARLAPTVVLALDPDAAGQAAAARTAISALAALPRRRQQLPDSLGRSMVDVGLTVDLRIARIPAGAGDPDELIERDPEAWKSLLDGSIPAFEFYFDTVVESVDRSQDAWRQEIIDRVLPVIQEFPFAVGVQAAWIERLAEATGVQPRLLQNQLKTSSPGGQRRRSVVTARTGSRASQPRPTTTLEVREVDVRQEAEDSLLGILLPRPCPAEVVPALNEIQPARRAVAELLERCVSAAGTNRRPNLEGLSPEAQELARRLMDATAEELSEARIVPAIRLHLATIRLVGVRRRLDDLRVSLAEIGVEDGDTGRRGLRLVLEERAELEQQIDTLQQQVLAGV